MQYGELHNLYSSPYIVRMVKSRRMRWVGHVAHIEKMRNADTILDRKSEGKKPLRKSKCGWDNNIKVDIIY
jgi:hypothetical protein